MQEDKPRAVWGKHMNVIVKKYRKNNNVIAGESSGTGINEGRIEIESKGVVVGIIFELC